MPGYRVKMSEKRPVHPNWPTYTLWIKAVSAKHAMEKAEAKDKNAAAIKAVKYSTDHDHWRKLWRQAYENMPARTASFVSKEWIIQETGTVPVGDYIKGVADKTIYKDEGGSIYKLKTNTRRFYAGRLAMLTKLLQYCRNRGGQGHNHDMGHMTVARNMAVGARPRREWRRELLEELASKDGTKIALAKLNARYAPVKLRKRP